MTLEEEALLARWQYGREKGLPPEQRLDEDAPATLAERAPGQTNQETEQCR